MVICVSRRKYFHDDEMILCFLKSQSEIEMDWRWSDFTLTFWRNIKVKSSCENIFVVHNLAWTHFTEILSCFACKKGVFNHYRDIILWMVLTVLWHYFVGVSSVCTSFLNSLQRYYPVNGAHSVMSVLCHCFSRVRKV